MKGVAIRATDAGRDGPQRESRARPCELSPPAPGTRMMPDAQREHGTLTGHQRHSEGMDRT
ncbi:hypothetical protein JCM9957A_55620 [Kineosporia succinea]